MIKNRLQKSDGGVQSRGQIDNVYSFPSAGSCKWCFKRKISLSLINSSSFLSFCLVILPNDKCLFLENLCLNTAGMLGLPTFWTVAE